MAFMLELLQIKPGMTVLEIGAGSGYNAALLAHLTGASGKVISVEVTPQLAETACGSLASTGYERVVVAVRDGFYGAQEHAPYDRMIVTAGCQDLSPH